MAAPVPDINYAAFLVNSSKLSTPFEQFCCEFFTLESQEWALTA